MPKDKSSTLDWPFLLLGQESCRTFSLTPHRRGEHAVFIGKRDSEMNDSYRGERWPRLCSLFIFHASPTPRVHKARAGMSRTKGGVGVCTPRFLCAEKLKGSCWIREASYFPALFVVFFLTDLHRILREAGDWLLARRRKREERAESSVRLLSYVLQWLAYIPMRVYPQNRIVFRSCRASMFFLSLVVSSSRMRSRTLLLDFLLSVLCVSFCKRWGKWAMLD